MKYWYNALKISLLVCFVLFIAQDLLAQRTLTGTLKDKETGEPLSFANVVIKGTTVGATTDLDGNFAISVIEEPPYVLVATYIGFEDIEITIDDPSKKIKIQMSEAGGVELDVVEVKARRISEKNQESAQTIEALDIIAIKETPAASFYEGLGNLKGVDQTSASLGFTIINTRGFNSTSPVRSLQTIDGVDNQAPGLNFSLGNFLGSPELDVQKVEIVVGANSAYYGPNAFNGVISMNTRDPFLHQGLSLSAKAGERSLLEGAVRFAHAFSDKDGKEKLAFKLNLSYLTANDWEADNFDEVYQEDPADYVGTDNPGGYDAVNIYGDESFGSIFDAGRTANDIRQSPGLGRFYRTGYKEADIVNYDTKNLKTNAAIHYKLTSNTELIVGGNYGTGTTVYQGDNRFSLNGLKFYQGKVEVRQKDKFFLRAYTTHEDGGNTYDAYFTALKLLERSKTDVEWAGEYRSLWRGTPLQGVPWDINYTDSLTNLVFEGAAIEQLPTAGLGEMYPVDEVNAFLSQGEVIDLLQDFHDSLKVIVNTYSPSNSSGSPYLDPNSEAFEEALKEITSKTHIQGGTGFYDKSALYHVHGEYHFKPSFLDDLTVGANYRMYRPKSNRTIFDESIAFDTTMTASGDIAAIDTTFGVITNQEFGVYAGLEKKILDDRFKINATLRLDKNQNFDYLLSPAISGVYTHSPEHIVRLAFSSAIRNPTLTDQYLRYNVGRAILLGNINGFGTEETGGELVSLESFNDYRSAVSLDLSQLDTIFAPAVKPEKVISGELGYRTTLAKSVYVDASYYFSLYRDFIGYKVGLDADGFDELGNPIRPQIYRVSANAEDVVTTQGFSVGVNYYFATFFGVSGNYSWNRLNTQTDDPIVPAFNTPEHKFNVGFSGRNIKMPIGENFTLRNFGFNVNYKWIEGFLFEGSPQFTGDIPTYSLLDAQVNYRVPRYKTTFKLGASNLLNNRQYQVYGGPKIGRMAYISIVFESGKLSK